MKKRLRLHVNGIVQGVGFRPYVYNLAGRLGLSGFVGNNASGVFIEIQGKPALLEAFTDHLTNHPPPLAEITHFSQHELSVQEEQPFYIQYSEKEGSAATLISPDVALCHDCHSELLDPNNRRFRYPFINCTNCGPRFTIIRDIPYDRPKTTMAGFRLCPDCRSEYENPADRRFHAQPTACSACGPQVWLESTTENKVLSQNDEAVTKSVAMLYSGKILAVKGLGGFHLTADATNDAAVKLLRRRKNREEKPLAVMVRSLEAAAQICLTGEQERQWLSAGQRPIVLLLKKKNIPVAEAVAPGNHRLGVMLAYTPLHVLLLEDLYRQTGREPVLVMTSANLSEEPIVIDNEEARQRLNSIADALLLHNRDILIRSDDSVLMMAGAQPVYFRRSRGFVPRPVTIKPAGPSLLCVGAELKNTIALTRENQVFLSQHIGDLENLQANQFFESSIRHLQTILEISPTAVVYDLHPSYFSTQWVAASDFTRKLGVQHHQAHMAAVMAEHHLDEPALGIILDGTGYGLDGTIWGGEFFHGPVGAFERLGHLQVQRIPGGKQAIREPWRIALSYLHQAFDGDFPDLPFLNKRPVEPIIEMLEKDFNAPKTSSCGRLFDAVAALAGGRSVIHYEGQAAIEMMQQSGNIEQAAIFDFDLEENNDTIILRLETLIRSIVRAVQEGRTFSEISARFHKTLIEMVTNTAIKLKTKTGTGKVVLSGGVFQNELLVRYLPARLEQAGFEVFLHQQVSPNDSGIALGQALVGMNVFAGQE